MLKIAKENTAIRRKRTRVTSPGLMTDPGACRRSLIVLGYVPHNADAPSRYPDAARGEGASSRGWFGPVVEDDS
jgi:hypothetical protein